MQAARLLPLTLLLGALAVPTTSEAAQPPEHSIGYTNLFAGRINPLGLIELFELQYKVRLYNSDSKLFENNFLTFGLRPALTPAWGRLAAVVRFQPVSFFQLWGEYGLGGHFGSFGLMQSFRYADAPYSDTDLDANEEAGLTYSATGGQFALGALLQLKAGPVAARSSWRFIRPNHNLRDGDNAYYDIVYDVVVPDKGWALNKDTDLLYVSDFGLVIGARWTYTHVFTGNGDLSPGVTDNPNSPLHRLGPLVAYKFWDEPGSNFDKPTVLLVANWWLKHPSRTGQDTSQAIPYVVIGFSFQGELWRGD